MSSLPDSAVSPLSAPVIVYRLFLVCSYAVAAVALAFFFIGVADGSVSSFNMGLWFALLAGLAAIVWAGLALRAAGKTGLAIAVLGVAAVPGLIAAFLVVVLLLTEPRWN